MASPLRAALIDVGGTLWPDGWIAPTSEEERGRVDILSAELPLPRDRAAELVQRLHALAAEAVPAEAVQAGLIQRTDEVVTTAVVSFGLEQTAAEVIRRAMGTFAIGEERAQDRLFDGAEELLRTAKDSGLRTVIVSNTFWRNADGYRRDFEDLRVGELIDGVVTSLDTGFRKPHGAMFDEALRVAGCAASECVFIGNSEQLDVEPAAERGMRTIRVAIEESAPDESRADAVVTSLAEAASTLLVWTREPSGS